MNCITVDDEPLALDLMEDFIKKVPFLNLVKKCKNAIEAIEVLHKEKIDLIFLDIHMPNISGIDFISSLENKPGFIFTTAYTNYAIEGFDLNAIDYLVKPIPFDRFLKAVNKAYDYHTKINRSVNSSLSDKQDKKDYIFVKADYQTVKINFRDIQYIEGLKDYIKIYTSAVKPVLTLMSLKSLEEKLPQNDFIRIHRSYIVPIGKIDSIRRSRIRIGDKQIPVGENYKERFFNRVDLNNGK